MIELVLARWRSFYREPGAIFWTFGFPLLLTIALGVAFRRQPASPTDVAVVRGPGADAVMSELAKSKDVHARLLDPSEAPDWLRTAKVAIVVEPGPPRTYRYDPMRPEG